MTCHLLLFCIVGRPALLDSNNAMHCRFIFYLTLKIICGNIMMFKVALQIKNRRTMAQ